MPEVNMVEFAKALKISKQRVAQGIKDGVIKSSVRIITKAGKKSYKIDMERGLKEWADNIDPAKQRDPDKQLDTKAMGDQSSTASNYQRAKAVKETFAAKLAQLEYEEKAGRLVPVAQVKAEAFKVARNVRDSLMGVPERMSAELASMKDPREIAIYVRAQIADALKDLQGVANVGQPRA